MIEKILIANRGEIACRIIRTAEKMGIKTVAIYSPVDKNALHVIMADESVALKGNPASESYLDVQQIIDACKSSGANAVHPGYGFLSENADFARALEEAGIIFIGPSPDAIDALGDKITAKSLARKVGVATVPGHSAAIPSADEAIKIADALGYPVILKASAGGGGKGMRVARSTDEVREGFTLSSSEALSSFGDGRMFIEKYIDAPRHIEVQILADQHGNVISLYDRECTLQRRHQKVIEEAPSPFIDEETRQEMCRQAVLLAKEAGYVSAGTVEFVVAPDKTFYFLEMNTRLQVEHPVTEEITGLDLVEWMIRIANNEALPWTMDNLPPRKGHAIEVRVYAEDPLRGFLPSIGRLTHYTPPPLSDGMRIETGVREGDEISVYYDPMIAKLVAYGPDRHVATNRIRSALDAFVVDGLRCNITFLAALVNHQNFATFDFSTNFIGDVYGAGFTPSDPTPDQLEELLVVVGYVHDKTMRRLWAESPSAWAVRHKEKTYQISVKDDRVSIDGRPSRVKTEWQTHQLLWQGTVNTQPISVRLRRNGPHWTISRAGVKLNLTMMRAHVAALAERMPEKPEPDLSALVLSPMPGLLLHLHVKEGEHVKAGQPIAVVEAMKMENVLRATHDATVHRIHAKEGESLIVDQMILEFAI